MANQADAKIGKNSAYLVLYESEQHKSSQERLPINPRLLQQIQENNSHLVVYQQIFENNLIYFITITAQSYLKREDKSQETLLQLLEVVLQSVFRLINQSHQANTWAINECTAMLPTLYQAITHKAKVLSLLHDYSLHTHLIENAEVAVRLFSQECLHLIHLT